MKVANAVAEILKREGTPALLEFITEKAVDVSRFG